MPSLDQLPARRARTPPAEPRGVRVDPADPCWQLAQRIAVSRSLGRSPLLSNFLLHVCERGLRELPGELTEGRIGVAVFGRSEGYNSNDDNIVRNYARMLRKRLDEYFLTEGRDEELRLEIPRGGYVPVFTAHHPERESAVAEPAAHPPLPAPTDPAVSEDVVPNHDASPVQEEAAGEAAAVPAPRVRPDLWAVAALLLILVVLLAVHEWRHAGQTAPEHGSPGGAAASLAGTAPSNALYDVFWSSLFQRGRDTFLVPADSGLVLLQTLTQRPVTLNDYSSGNYHGAAQSVSVTAPGMSAADVGEFGTRRYTSIVDLNLVLALARLPQVVPGRVLVRFARDLRLDDLRSNNAILLGSVDANPWESLFESQMSFHFRFSPERARSPVIVNANPRPGEQATYINNPRGAVRNTFATVAYLPNLDGSGHVLLVAGLTMAGTQAAGNFVLTRDLLEPTLKRARAANGTLRPFELLIETDEIAASATRPRVVAERIGPS